MNSVGVSGFIIHRSQNVGVSGLLGAEFDVVSWEVNAFEMRH